MVIRALIVDDEVLERDKLRLLLEEEDGFTVVGECSDGRRGAAEVARLEPHLVFMDVQTPRLEADALLAELERGAAATVVVAISYEASVLRALQARPWGYLLKPIDPDCFHALADRLRRALARFETGDLPSRLRRLRDAEGAPRRYPEQVTLRFPGRMLYLRTEDIDWLEADGENVRYHQGGRTLSSRGTLDALGGQLDPERFVRVHPEVIVNVERIREVRSRGRGEPTVVLHDGTELTAGGDYRDQLLERLGEAAATG